MGLTDQDWIGSAVSLTCDEELGVFQGLIKKISADEITIVRAFRNGVPLRKQNAEVVLRCSDIKSINLIELKDVETTTPTAVINKPTPVKLPHFSNILGKQQQLQQQQQQLLQQQQKQQAQLEREQELPATPARAKQANGHGNGSRNGGYAAPGVNSALSDKMQQLMLHANNNGSNGMRRYGILYCNRFNWIISIAYWTFSLQNTAELSCIQRAAAEDIDNAQQCGSIFRQHDSSQG